MGRMCKYCKKGRGRGSEGRTLHPFPEDAASLQIWRERLNLPPSFFPTKHTTICSDHFSTKCFLRVQKRKILLPGSVPEFFSEVKHCCVYCKATRDSKPFISLRKFPLNKPDILKKWLQAINIENFVPDEDSLICSDHFQKSCFQQIKGKKRLNLTEDAVPSIFLLESQKAPQKPADGPNEPAEPYPQVDVDMANPNDDDKDLEKPITEAAKRCEFEANPLLLKPATECRERWKKLRADFVRSMKPCKSDGGAGKTPRKAYYLSDAMKFAFSYINALNVPRSENQSGIQNNDKQQDQEQMQLDDDTDSESLPDICLSPQHARSELSSPIPSSPSLELCSTQPATTWQRRNKLFAKQNRISSMRLDRHDTNRDLHTEALEMFLMSIVPDLQKMTDEEVRRFKHKTLDAVDDIFSARNCHQNETTPHSSSQPHSSADLLITNVKSEYPEPKSSPCDRGSE